MAQPPRAITEFIGEANEILDALSRDLLALDEHRGEEPDPELLNQVFRAAHTLKGLSGMFGQEAVSHLAHQMEDALDAVRMGKVELGDAVLDGLIDALDALGALLRAAAEDREAPEAFERANVLGTRLTALARPHAARGPDLLDEAGIDQAVRSVLTEYEEHRLRENLRKGVGVWKLRAVFSLSDFDQRLAALNQALKAVGEVVSTLPSSEPGDGDSIAFDLLFGSGVSRERLEKAAPDTQLSLIAAAQSPAMTPGTVQRIAPGPRLSAPRLQLPRARQTQPLPVPLPSKPRPPVPSANAPGPSANPPGPTVPPIPSFPQGRTAPPMPSVPHPRLTVAPTVPDAQRVPLESSLRSLAQTVRVDISRLDDLMNAVGELHLVHTNVQRLAELARGAQSAAMPKLYAQELAREARSLERKLDTLQKGILAARMVPLGQVFDRLARLTRRLLREQGKEVDLRISGGDVELDKLIVEELSDPLMHLLRNAIDHGVESPAQREISGKPRRAQVLLLARQQGNHVVIEVGDDGPGMNEPRIIDVALQRGLIEPERAQELDRRELLNLVFLPGFSTREEVSELSGRGVGLDVVKTNIARLSGIIDVDSAPGQGTRFVLTLPLTLAILRALVVSSSDRTYAVPLNSVVEIVSVKSSELRTVERREVLSLRGQTIPFVPLARLFGHEEAAVDRHYVVIVGLAQQRMGIAVDALLGQQDIVTKPLGGRLRSVPGVAGATDLGNRQAVLVLDVGALMEDYLGRKAAS
jgi:two-component system, chemotaxis family, sensor kinase CheA